MEPIAIQYELKKLGITQKEFAKELEISEMATSRIIHGKLIQIA